MSTRIHHIASDFFESQGWETHDARGRAQCAVVELVDRDHPDRTLRLNGDDTVEDAGLHDGYILRVFPESVAGCFLGNVRVTLANGQLKPIAEVQIEDVLVSGIPGSSQNNNTEILKKYKTFTSSYMIINNLLGITSTHPVWANSRWIRAGELKVGDLLQGIDATILRIESLQHKAQRADVWNLYVSSEAHTFFAEGILVHNMEGKTLFGEFPDSRRSFFAGRSEQEVENHFRDIESTVTALTNRIANLEILEDRVKDLEFRIGKISEGFEMISDGFSYVAVHPKG